jgi:hypothetical protein
MTGEGSMGGEIFESLRMLLMVSDIVVAVFAVSFSCIAIPFYGVRMRSAKSVVGSKPPANLRAFHAHGSAVHVRAAIEDFARRNGYAIAHADDMRGLLVLAGKPKSIFVPGLFFPVYLNQPAPDQVLVSVGCVSPLSGLVIPGEFPRSNSRGQNDFMHQLAADIVSSDHPSAPRLDGKQANPSVASDEVEAARTQRQYGPLVRMYVVAMVLYILLVVAVAVGVLLLPQQVFAGKSAGSIAVMVLFHIAMVVGCALYLQLLYRERGQTDALLRRVAAVEPLPQVRPPVARDAEPMPKNIIPLKTQISHGVIALALLGYGTYGIVVDEIIVPGKHSAIVLHGWAAGVLYAAMICAVLVLVSVIVDNYDKRDNERYYHLFAHFFQSLGYALFFVAVIVSIVVGSEPREYVKAMALAEKGDAAAQYSVGHELWYGKGVRQNFTEALSWLRKSAEQGDADAMNLIGYMHFYGEGVPVSLTEAETWYRRGATAGSARALNNLGLMYMDLQIRPKDFAKGVEYLRMAAERGNGRAMYNLGRAYRDGKGVEQDYAQAHAWFNLSSSAGVERGTEYAQDLESNMDADERREAQRLEDEWRRTHPAGR